MKLFRANTWWNAIVPQVLGWMYFCWLCNGAQLGRFIYTYEYLFFVFCFFVSLISISAFGYLFNDWCDIKSDAIAGKKNRLASLNPILQIVVVVVPLLIGCFFWMPVSITASILFSLQIISLIIYSVPPFRLKNRGVLGVAADAFYGHINPVFITLFVFSFFDATGSYYKVLIGSVLFVATSLKGIRNILLHQIEDRKKDKQAGIQTFVVKNSALFTLYFVNRLLYFEIAFTLALSLIISFFSPPFFLCLLLFSIITYLKFSGWKLADIPQRQLKFKFLYFLNDYYESWMPVFFLILLSTKAPVYLLFLLLHLFLFPNFWNKLLADIRTIKQNFKTEDDY